MAALLEVHRIAAFVTVWPYCIRVAAIEQGRAAEEA